MTSWMTIMLERLFFEALLNIFLVCVPIHGLIYIGAREDQVASRILKKSGGGVGIQPPSPLAFFFQRNMCNLVLNPFRHRVFYSLFPHFSHSACYSFNPAFSFLFELPFFTVSLPSLSLGYRFYAMQEEFGQTIWCWCFRLLLKFSKI
jgi:hypothetical protein